MINYEFGAGGFKLGERVDIRMTKQRGILVSEAIHVSGCNTYQVLLPSILIDGWTKTTHRDHLLLRRLDAGESIFDGTKELTDENSFSPKGIDASAEWILAAADADKEFLPEIDDAVGVEEVAVSPGSEVWNKVYGKVMTVSYITRNIYSKELEYCAVYMDGAKEVYTYSRSYTLIPLVQKLDLPPPEKLDPVFEDGRRNIERRR